MANTNANVLRHSFAEASASSELLNLQLGYCTDTYKLAYKEAGGTIRYFNSTASTPSFALTENYLLYGDASDEPTSSVNLQFADAGTTNRLSLGTASNTGWANVESVIEIDGSGGSNGAMFSAAGSTIISGNLYSGATGFERFSAGTATLLEIGKDLFSVRSTQVSDSAGSTITTKNILYYTGAGATINTGYANSDTTIYGSAPSRFMVYDAAEGGLGLNTTVNSGWSGVDSLIEFDEATTSHNPSFHVFGSAFYTTTNLYRDGANMKHAQNGTGMTTVMANSGYTLYHIPTGVKDAVISGTKLLFQATETRTLFNYDNLDVDFTVYASSADDYFFIEGAGGNIGQRTTTPMLNVGTASGDFSTADGIHIKGGTATTTPCSVIIEGALSASLITCDTNSAANDKIFEIKNDGGLMTFAPLDDDTSTRTYMTDQDAVAKTTALTIDMGDGDIYSDKWADYSGTSTISGWSSYSYKEISTMRLGRLVYVQFNIRGTKDGTTSASFTLPYQSATSMHSMIRARDNGADLTTPGMAIMNGASNVVNLYSDCATAAWTASAGMRVYGEFFYYTNES